MMPGMDFFAAEQFLVMVRFGMWGAILEEPRPSEKYQTLTALWLHARGMALASTGKLDRARADAKALRTLSASLPPDLQAGMNPARNVAALGLQAVEARIAERTGQRAEAIAAWKRAVAIEDGMAYNEPADWFYPMRHYLGAVLLDAKQAKEAEQVFREDLRRNPGNGWALYGLSRALRRRRARPPPRPSRISRSPGPAPTRRSSAPRSRSTAPASAPAEQERQVRGHLDVPPPVEDGGHGDAHLLDVPAAGALPGVSVADEANVVAAAADGCR